MKEIFAFISKEFKHIFRDVRTIMIVLVMPIVQIVLFGFALSTEVHNAVVDIAGDRNDPQVREIAARIDASPYLQVGKYLYTPSQVDSRLRKGRAAAALCFGDRFAEGLGSGEGASVSIIADGSDPNTSQTVTAYIKGVLSSVQAEMAAGGAQAGAVNTAVAAMASGGIRTALLYNPAMNSSYNFVPGVIGLILMLICSMMTSVSIVREKELGTMELVLVSPVKPFWIVLSKMVPYLILSLINYISILLLSYFVMDVPIRGSLWLLSLASFIFIGASLGLGILVSIISKTQQTALLICGMGLTMPTMMLSGLIFPCESMPVILQAVSDIVPAKWYISIVKKIMIEGVGFSGIALDFTILTAMAVFLLIASTKKFKTRL